MIQTFSVHNSTVNIVAGDQINISYCDGLPVRAQFIHWLQRLADHDYLSKHASACDQYVKGTCQWFIGDKRFANWVDGRTKTLICLGCPGAGKTVIVSFVVEYLISKFKHAPDVCVAYVYCDYKEQSKQTPRSLLAILLQQLVLKMGILCPEAEEFFTQYQGQHVSHAILLGIVRDMVRRFQRVFIAVDALDEWSKLSDQHALALYQMLGTLGDNVYLLITARLNYAPLLHLNLCLNSFLPIYARDHDIKLYAKINLKWLAGLLDKEMMDLIVGRVVSRSGGMFLLAKLSLELGRQWNYQQLTDSSAPLSIQSFYDHIMKRIEEEGNINLMRHISFWITYSMRPLYVHELRAAISPSQILEGSTIELFRYAVIKACAGLVIVDQVNALRFIHFTTHQYVEQHVHFSTNPHADIVRVCLGYMAYCAASLLAGDVLDHESPADTYYRVHAALDSFAYPFLRYAAHAWGFHAQHDEDQALEDVIRFLNDKTQVALACLLLQPPERAGTSNRSPLHIVAYFNLPITAQKFIDYGLHVDSPDDNGRTPLSFAAERGSMGVLDTLLANGADVNRADNAGDTALAWAARHNQNKVIKRLGGVHLAKLDSRNSSRTTPLCIAASSGHAQALHILLRLAAASDEGQDASSSRATRDGITSMRERLLEMRTSGGQTALMLGAWNGHIRVVEILLKAGANVNAQDKKGFTPLSETARNGHIRVIEILLQAGANVNLQDKKEVSPISKAAERGEEKVVEVLLENKADVNAKDMEGNTLLARISVLRSESVPRDAVAMDGRMNAVKRILRHPGIEVDSRNGSDSTPLINAAGYRDVPTQIHLLPPDAASKEEVHHPLEVHFNNIVNALLDAGADVNICNLDGQYPIMQAVSRGRLEIVKTLLDRGARVDVADNASITLFHSAVHARHVGIMKLLLRVGGPKIDAVDRNGFTALGHAAKIGHEELVRLLLHAGAQVNCSHRNPLSLAAREGHERIVEILLGHGAHAAYQSSHLTTPLHLAVVGGHKRVMDYLLDKCRTNSSIDVTNRNNRTPLIYATLHGHVAIVRALLDRGADVNTRDCQGRSALSYAAGNGRHELTKVLLEHKDVDVDKDDNDNKSPIWHAVRWGHKKVLKELIGSCSFIEPYVTLATVSCRSKIADYLRAVQCGRDWEDAGTNGRMPIDIPSFEPQEDGFFPFVQLTHPPPASSAQQIEFPSVENEFLPTHPLPASRVDFPSVDSGLLPSMQFHPPPRLQAKSSSPEGGLLPSVPTHPLHNLSAQQTDFPSIDVSYLAPTSEAESSTAETGWFTVSHRRKSRRVQSPSAPQLLFRKVAPSSSPVARKASSFCMSNASLGLRRHEASTTSLSDIQQAQPPARSNTSEKAGSSSPSRVLQQSKFASVPVSILSQVEARPTYAGVARTVVQHAQPTFHSNFTEAGSSLPSRVIQQPEIASVPPILSQATARLSFAEALRRPGSFTTSLLVGQESTTQCSNSTIAQSSAAGQGVQTARVRAPIWSQTAARSSFAEVARRAINPRAH